MSISASRVTSAAKAIGLAARRFDFRRDLIGVVAVQVDHRDRAAALSEAHSGGAADA